MFIARPNSLKKWKRKILISSELQKRKNAVLSFDYEIQPYSESAEDKKIADFCGDIIYALAKFEDVLLDLLDAIGKGFAMLEPIYQIDSKRVILSDLPGSIKNGRSSMTPFWMHLAKKL